MWVRPNMAKNCFLIDDNAPAHAALSVQHFLTSQCNTVSRGIHIHLISHLASSSLFQKVK